MLLHSLAAVAKGARSAHQQKVLKDQKGDRESRKEVARSQLPEGGFILLLG
jgi:hypothetical protein